MSKSKEPKRGGRPKSILGIIVVGLCLWGVWSYGLPDQQAYNPNPLPLTTRITPKLLGRDSAHQVMPAHTDCSAASCLALTFDDGPDPAVTPRILDILAHHHARATFFVLGNRAQAHPDIIKRMYVEGHEIGNHSWSHTDFTKLSPTQIEAEINSTQRAVMNAGVPAPRLFRPPYGAINAVVRVHVPLTLAMWNVDPEDWREKDSAKIIRLIEEQAAPGRVVDLHDPHAPTADALDGALNNLQSRFTLVTVSDLFNLTPGQRGEFYGR